MTNGIVTSDENLKTFSINYKSKKDNQTYQGEFTVRRLSIADIASLGVRKAQLNGAMHYNPETPGCGVDVDTDEFNGVIAHLQIVMVKHPDWWDLNKVNDLGVMYAVYEEVMKFERYFLERASEESTGNDEDGQTTGNSTDEESNDIGTVTKVVGGEVQASLDP